MTPLRPATTAVRVQPGAAEWCGWVLIGAAGLTPLLAWLSPLGFAALLSLVGLLCLPAARIEERDRPMAVVLLAALAWAATSSLWSPYRPAGAGSSVALKLALQIVLYWVAWQAARRADARLRRLALCVFAWGLAALGVLLLAEAFTGGGIYMTLREAIHDPIRPDLGRKNLAQASFVLALLWPVAAAGGARAGAPIWLAVPMAAGAAVLAELFLADAPVISVGLAIAIGAMTWAWPRTAPKAIGLAVALLILVMPLLVLGLELLDLGLRLPESWAQRLGYWIYATERIGEQPWRGWGLDASRSFGANIGLHPHNGALQLWLELGAVGAAFAALVWAMAFRSIAREERSLVAAGAAGSLVVYLLFGAVSFGVWQEWWLALGALVAVVAALGEAEERARQSPIDAAAQYR